MSHSERLERGFLHARFLSCICLYFGTGTVSHGAKSFSGDFRSLSGWSPLLSFFLLRSIENPSEVQAQQQKAWKEQAKSE